MYTFFHLALNTNIYLALLVIVRRGQNTKQSSDAAVQQDLEAWEIIEKPESDLQLLWHDRAREQSQM